MNDDRIAELFERERPALIGLAYRLLGSRAAAEDAVQDAWLRLTGADADAITNLPGWLRTVVARLALDRLRARATGPIPVDPLPERAGVEPIAPDPSPEQVIELADEVSRLLLALLARLTPAERVAVVVHDMFAVPYSQIAPMLGRSAEATKKLAARARAKIRGQSDLPSSVLSRHRAVVDRFLRAARAGDVAAIIDVLDPDVERVAEPAALAPRMPARVVGATEVARGTALLAERSRQAEIALVDGDIGLVVATQARVIFVITFRIAGELITGYEVIADPKRLARLSIAAGPANP